MSFFLYNRLLNYVILSYVWGTDKVVTTMKNILHEVEILGASFDKLETSNNISKTISDVML